MDGCRFPFFQKKKGFSLSKRNIFPVDKSLEQPERVMLVGVMLSADYSGANEVRERTFQTTLDEAAELVAAAGGELVLRETAKRDKAHTAYFRRHGQGGGAGGGGEAARHRLGSVQP